MSLDLWNVLILAAVQGLTEFLPVSSSGHLVLLEHWLGTAEGNVMLAVVLHCGTLGSVLWVYRRELLRLARLDREGLRYLLALAVGTVPAAAVGLLLDDLVDRLFASPLATGAALLVTAAILWSTRSVRRAPDRAAAVWRPRSPGLGRALLIGAAQAVAITPGISRSGTTIAASLWLGLERGEAARFSFLLSVPAIGGALLLGLLKEDWALPGGAGTPLAGLLVAFLFGVLAVRWTARAVRRRRFWLFSLYCLGLGLATMLAVGRGG